MMNKLQKLMLLMLTMVLAVGMEAKKVHTLGDSTMAPYDENTTNTRGWGMYFGNFLTNGWTSVNYAKGGRDSRMGYTELWQNAKNSVEAGDYVLIQFAHNDTQFGGMDNLELQAYYTKIGDTAKAADVKKDGRGTVPNRTYKECLKQIVDAVKEKGAIPVLVSSVCRCYFTNGVAPITRAGRHDMGDKYQILTENGPVNGPKLAEDDHSYDFRYQMEQLATEEGVAFIDMTTATKELYESYETYDKCYAALFEKGGEKDNTHYNLTGAMTAARLCAQLMKDKGLIEGGIEIPTDLAVTPSSVDLGEGYLGKTAMKELTLSGLGLDPSTGTVTITATEGIMLSTDKQNWQESLAVDYQNGTVIKTFYARVTLSKVGKFNGTVTATLGQKTAEVPVTINVVELGGGDPFTVNWTMSSSDKETATTTGEGAVTTTSVKYENLETYGYVGGFGAMIAPTGSTGAWPTAAEDDQNQYVQFAITAPAGKKLDINSIQMKIKAQGGGSLQCHVYYSTDGFVTRKTIFSTNAALTGTWNEISNEDVIKVDEGEQLLIRVYPWSGTVDNGRWICISDVAVSGQSKDAAGVNITGSISYTLDKGGLTENNGTQVIDPETLAAGFAAMTWGYDGTNEKVKIEGTTFYGAAGNTKMMQLRYDAATTETLSTTANDDCTVTLTLTPEDGFTFVPTKVSFLAGKFNSGNPHLTFAAEAGDKKETLKNNVDLNRSNTNPKVDPSQFEETLDGYTATADTPLKLHFSFLNVQGTRSAGIANVVVEGQLVGAAQQVTKYMLTTQVVPSAEAGSISRDPELEQYKEGSQVTLKATANFGYKFVKWQDAAGATVSTDAETTITMDAEKTMKAVFEAVNVYKVTTKCANDAERDGLGSITLTPNDHQGQYEAGTKISATANESKIIKFTHWEDNSTSATREITVDKDMTITANYEVQDFIAVFDASKTAAYDYEGKAFAADEVWDNQRNAKSCIVKLSDGSMVYTKTGGTPVVRNRQGVVLSSINGLYQNGYNTAEIAWQYQFSTVGFTSATFTADMAAKNAATKNWKAQYSTDGTTYNDLGAAWEMTANVAKELSLTLPADAIGKETVYVRIMGTGTELLSTSYDFTAGEFCGLNYTTHSESGVGNVYVLGEAVVENDEVAPKLVSTVPATGATGVSATGKITLTFDERIESANSDGAVTLGDKALQPEWSSRSVTFSYSQLDYGTQYTFSMPTGYVQDKSGNKFGEAVTITFTTMERPTVEKGSFDFIVPTDGTIDEALAAANNRADKATRYRIFIKNSDTPYVFHPAGTVTGGDGQTYNNPISVLTAANTSFIGESIEGVVLTNETPDATWDNGFGAACPLEGIGKGDVLQIAASATNSYFQNLTIKSSMGDKHGRDVVLHDYATHTIFKDACLWAYQDTYVSNKQDGAYYFEGGIIRGRTDFICGPGDAFFNKVDIIMCEKGGYIVAPQGNSKYGYVFKDCTIKGSQDDVNGNYYLGRAWTAAAETYFIDTKMEVQPAVAGWHEWNNGPTRFAEYNSMNASGAAIDLSGRATVINGTPNNPVLTDEEAATIGNPASTFGDWQPQLLTEQAPVPTEVKIDSATGVLSWTGSSYALTYAVCLDGDVVAFTTETSYNTAAEVTAPRRASGEKQWTVRAANEMGGLSEASAAATYTTGIETMHNAQDTMHNEVYDLQGRRIERPTKGLYIVNGKKVVIK